MLRNTHYVLIDGANIDGVLGQILGRQPESEERPRWDNVMKFSAESLSPDGRRAHFLIAVDGEKVPSKIDQFISFLVYHGIRPWLLKREGARQVVDEAINKVLARMLDCSNDSNILLLSHDGGFADTLKEIRKQDPERVIAVLGFPEYMSSKFDEIEGIRKYDLERDVQGGFTRQLPRIVPIAIDDWNPDDLLNWPSSAHGVQGGQPAG